MSRRHRRRGVLARGIGAVRHDALYWREHCGGLVTPKAMTLPPLIVQANVPRGVLAV